MQIHGLHAICFACLAVLGCFFGQLVVSLPVLLLVYVTSNCKLHDRCLEAVIGTWYYMVAGYLELVYGIKLVITGDGLERNEGCVIIMNHRTQMDWILLWNLLARFGNVRRCKIILKDSLKKLPGIGWAAQQNLYLFVSRSWEKDKEHFHSVLNYFVETNKPVQMLIFPEGTDFCKGTKQSSDKFAKKNNLPIYDYVLHPRTRGFSELVKVMRHGNVKSLLDVTVGYPVNIPWGFRSVILGNYPEQVHFNIKKYSIDELPEDTEELQQWCQDRWAEKEETLRQFYDKKHFNQPQILFAVPEKQMWRKMSLCLILWAAFVLLAFFLFYMSSFWCWYCLAGCLIYLILTVTGGAERVLLSANKRLNCSSR